MFKRKLRLLRTIFVLVFIIIVFRLYQVQVWQHSAMATMAQKQFNSVVYQQPRRGIIYDCNGQVLALTVEVNSCAVRPKQVKDPVKVSQQLAALLDLSYQQVYAGVTSSRSFVWLKRKPEPGISRKIENIDIPGIVVVKENRRFYPEGGLARAVIGVVGMDNQGLSGIECYFDKILRGLPVKYTRTRDALGRLIQEDEKESSEAGQPKNIVLTLDKVIQYITERELKSACDKYKAKTGIAVVEDTKSGAILALAQYPSFDGNNWSGFSSRQLENWAVHTIFEPGSTFKIVAAAAALETGLFKKDDKIFCENGRYKVADKFIHDHEKQGWLTLAQVIEYSSNIGVAKLAEKLGKEKLYSSARNFGFGNSTGITLPGETSGILRLPNKWSGTSLAMVSFGQEVGVNALQLIGAYACIANKGVLLEPAVIKEIFNLKGENKYSFSPAIIRQVIPAEVAGELSEMLAGVVERGTGKEARVEGYRVAGKTGTAQKFDPQTKKYSPDRYVASFCGFLPAEKPRIAILIILDEPQTDYYWGGTVSAPVFSRIATQVMNYLNIPSLQKVSQLALKNK
ncbi:MAG: penicillin-binding protein 2 [Elusimicrobiota bacterium]